MSRYSIPAKDPNLEVAVGWDDGLETFFGMVRDDRLPEEECVLLWLGARLREVVSIEELSTGLAEYADIPADIQAKMFQDFVTRRADRRPALLKKLVERINRE